MSFLPGKPKSGENAEFLTNGKGHHRIRIDDALHYAVYEILLRIAALAV